MTRPVVEVEEGRLQGIQTEAVSAYLGIPFARPPTGAQRFGPPGPVEPWAGVRDASRFGAVALQVPTILETSRGLPDSMSEDCLTLNVWTAAAAGSEPVPVLVWLHGGAFVNGAGSISWYDGSALAGRGDIIVVTTNYRLGALGYLDLSEIGGPGYDSSGSVGLQDQIAALEWVQRNIAAFGGDPRRVCLVGESAGSMSVGTLLATKAAGTLFQRAIMQSGGPTARSRSFSTIVATLLFEELSLPAEAVGIERLLTLTPDEITAGAVRMAARAQEAAFSGGQSGGFSWAPTVDGVVVPSDPMSAIAAGAAAGVPVMIGTTADEMRIVRVLEPDLPPVDSDELEGRLTAELGSAARAVLDAYETLHPGWSADDRWWAISSDRIFGLITASFLDVRVACGAPTWTYRFDWRSPVRGGYFGSAHTFEIPFVFGTFTAPGVEDVLGPITPEMRALAGCIQEAWTTFAATGRPASAALPPWAPCGIDARPTMLLDENCVVVEDPFKPTRQLWTGMA